MGFCGLEELIGNYKHILLLVYYPRGPILLRDSGPQPPSKKKTPLRFYGERDWHILDSRSRPRKNRKNFSSGAGNLKMVTRGAPLAHKSD